MFALLAIGAIVYVLRTPDPVLPIEVPVREIPLAGRASESVAELSGLAMRHDTLVMLPQYPARHGSVLFALTESQIEGYLDTSGGAPLTPSEIPLDSQGIEDTVQGFDGFEAIAFGRDEHVYFAVEGLRSATTSAGFLVRGRVEGDLARIVLEPEHLVSLPPQNELENTGYEAIVLQGDRVLALYETYGEVNPHPRVMAADLDLTGAHELPMAPLEYRITDATAIDRTGSFWVANYHWPGAPWSPGSCSLTERYGRGASHSRCATVERLVELHVTDQGVVVSDRAPIQLELIDDDHARNWEGVVRFGEHGFLLVTDEYPRTTLGYVEASSEN